MFASPAQPVRPGSIGIVPLCAPLTAAGELAGPLA